MCREIDTMAAKTHFILVVGLAVAAIAQAASRSSPWVYSDNAPIQEGTLRITTLGSGSPDVRREQVSSPPPRPPLTTPPGPNAANNQHLALRCHNPG